MTPEIKHRIEQIRRDELPERYKKTKASIMPEEWEEKFIKDISSDIYAGATPETKVPEYWKNGTIPWLASGEIHKRRICQTEKSITEKGYLSSSTKMLPENCVLIALAGQGKTRGTVAVNKIPLCTNQSIAAIIPNNCYYQYLYYFLDIRYNNLREISSGDGTRGGLNLNLISNYPVTLPPLPEQQKIADVLTTQDRVIELKEQLLTQKQQQKKYLMQQLLTGKKRLPGFNGEWRRIKLGDFIQEIDERTICNNQHEILSVTKNGIVRQSEHFNKQIASENNIGYKVIRKGNLAFSTMNLWMGSLDVLSSCDVGIVSPAYKVFKLNKKFITVDFAKNFMKSSEMVCLYKSKSEQGASIVRRNLDLKALLDTEVFLPYTSEQNAIADVLSTADREIDLLRQSIEAEKQKKKALMQLLLTGIVRVTV